ncbi:MAG: hypothetical protein K2H53_02660 [Clostridia bacterium]|nr:hypothetical protein [Clostridia bacterium]
MGKRYQKKKRRVFTLYNFMVLVCIVVILGSAYILFDLEDEVSGFIASTKETVGNFIDKITSGKDEDGGKTNENKAKNQNTSKNESKNTPNNASVTGGNDTKAGEITEEEAKDIALARFTALGEQNVSKEGLAIKKIRRSGEEYYYITSSENTLEVKIEGGKITRINSVIVDN